MRFIIKIVRAKTQIKSLRYKNLTDTHPFLIKKGLAHLKSREWQVGLFRRYCQNRGFARIRRRTRIFRIFV